MCGGLTITVRVYGGVPPDQVRFINPHSDTVSVSTLNEKPSTVGASVSSNVDSSIMATARCAQLSQCENQSESRSPDSASHRKTDWLTVANRLSWRCCEAAR